MPTPTSQQRQQLENDLRQLVLRALADDDDMTINDSHVAVVASDGDPLLQARQERAISDADVINDIGLSSIDVLQLRSSIQDRYHISMVGKRDAFLAALKTLSSLAEFVAQHRGDAANG